MNYKLICILLSIFIIFLLRCYWLPVIKKLLKFKTEAYSGNIELVNPKVYEDLKWSKSNGIMPFIGTYNYEYSRKFYADIGFIVESGENIVGLKLMTTYRFGYKITLTNNGLIIR